jgi:hypothetical protein
MEKPIKIEVEKHALALSNVIFQHTAEEFGFLLVSGHVGRQYVSSPAHAKRIWLRLGEHIKAFEEKNGAIKAELPKKTVNESGEDKKIGF